MSEAAVTTTWRHRPPPYARRLIEASPDPLLAIGIDGRVLDTNEATVKATGVPRKRLIGSDFSDYFTDPQKARAAFRMALEKGAVRDYPLTIRRASGKVSQILWKATAYRDRGGRAAGVCAALHDISELARAEAELQNIARFPLEDPNPVFRIGRSGEILFANPAAERMYPGRRAKRARASDAWSELIRTVAGLTAPKQFEFRDGKSTYAMMAVPVPDADYLNVYAVDISERKCAERELAFDNAVLEAEHEASPDGILVTDPDDRIYSYNRRFVEMWGVPQEVLDTGTVWDAIRSVADKLPDVDSHLAKVRDLYAHRDKKSRNEIQLTDGRVFDRHSAPMTAPDGEYLGRVSFFRDVTAEKHAQERIKEDAAQFRGLVEQEVAGIYILREDGTIGYVNPQFARMFGYQPEDVIGRPFLDFIAEDQRLGAKMTFEAQISGRLPSTQFTTAVLRRNGARMDVLVHAGEATFRGRPASVGVLIDITERRRHEEALSRMNRALKALSCGNEVLVRAESEQQLLDEMCRVLQQVGGFALVSIGFASNDDVRPIRAAAWAGAAKEFLAKACNGCGCPEEDPCPVTAAIRTGEAQLHQDIATDKRMTPWRLLALGYGFGSCLALPLSRKDEVIGALAMFATEPRAFDDEEVTLLTELGNDVSYGLGALRDRLERENAIRALHESLEGTVVAIAGTIEARDPYTAGHQQRVARLAAAIARELGLPESQIQGIYLAGIVHDVGKINLPSEILTRPGKLSAAEREMIQGHATTGYNILKGVDFPWPIAQAVLQHHERLDGSGYPHALKGDEILIEARILAVADVVEAMTAHRPYRPALGLEPALEEIEHGRDRLYDPAVVDACIHLLKEKGFRFE